ncbi:alpha/beta hydrolase [Nocardioides sp.]|uniref:alpha/beta hydrolase n=1 Tax=Nocardioides sp. TaxID=35761 RepID=UPI00262EAD3B|nr:alpha/beta hydrolase [Nocardioides sp.]
MSQTMVRVIAGVTALALVLTGLGVALALVFTGDDDGATPDRDGPAPTTTPAPGATDAPDPALEEYYSQQLDWAPCEQDDDLECAVLTVPVDYAEPEGDTLRVALLKVPATRPDQRIGSLVVNPGGPGAPGTSYAASAGQVFRPALFQAYDIVGFDPRGTGASAPVDCLSDAEMDEFLAADPAPDTEAEVDAVVEGLEDFFEACEQNSPDIVGHVTTVETARDMDVLRAALGESELDYFGASYGTKLGATYAELFPDRVGRLVLDGAVDVSLSSRDLTLGQAAGFQRALEAYVGACVDAGDCFLGDSVDAGLQRIADFLDEVDAEPLPAGDRDLTVGNAFYGIITPLYVSDFWFLLDEALETAFRGDGTSLMRLADLYASRNPDGTYADNSTEAIYAINCLDDPGSTDPAKIPAQIPEVEEVSPTLGEVFAWSLVGCLGFDLEPAEEAPRIRAEGAAPILVVGTTRDPATPYEWAEALADQLASGVLLTRDGDGHTAYNSGNECIDSTIEAYLLEGTVPEDGKRC